jgi:hypothetical protein
MRVAAVALGSALALAVPLVVACGETRRPIGDECLRGEDCLSSFCASRTCVAAPVTVQGGGGPPPDEEPRIPAGEGGADAPTDARDGGG